MNKGDRIEILWWHNAEQESRWIPGVLLNRHEDGRCVVKADCGWYCNDAAPECVREASPADDHVAGSCREKAAADRIGGHEWGNI